jgi:2-oxoglutarate ferredoxin oxidoreductase subunit alpha
MQNNDYSIVISGEAGQGIDTVNELLLKTFKTSNLNVFSTKEYMSRIRGGCNSTEIRISSTPIQAPLERIDFLAALNNKAISHLEKRINNNTIILYDPEVIQLDDNYKKIAVPIQKMATEAGGKIFSNIILAGVILGVFRIDIEICEKLILEEFADKSPEIAQSNLKALYSGYEKGKEVSAQNNFSIELKQDKSLKDKILTNCNSALALGFISGGCDFISSYPMSPGTGILNSLSQNAEKYNILAEQTEDEISAVNMAIGAWYAGARAMVTTSGGGFDLMTEGVSLAGMIESPIVIHIAQRPGPATGLPTRTEQGDLELALYSGHGEFPRIILTPGNPTDSFLLAQNSFNMADKFQVPVFVLSDQYMIEASFISEFFDTNNFAIDESIVKTDKNYKRYTLTPNGISPRGIPNYGDGLVKVDSDEHDEEGHITEDFDVRVKMVDKRLQKHESISQEVYKPELIGSENYKTLLVGWGSTYGVIKEVIELIDSEDIAFLYFKQVYPLHDETITYLEKAQNVISIENNATGQFAKLIRRETGFAVNQKILKYNGLTFSSDELLLKVKECTNER